MINGSKVFSEFEVDQIGFRFAEDEKAALVGCIGSLEEETEVKKITKSCRGVVRKTIVRETGNGTLTLSLHIPYDIYNELLGRNLDGLAEGVHASGETSIHPSCCLTAHVTDEDGDVKYRAYPNCVVAENSTRKIENGGEEVAETEMTLSYMPDDNGIGMYEALAKDVSDEIAAAWMEQFTTELVAAAAVAEGGN